MEYKDHPLNDVVRDANAKIADGATVHQKFTCEHCGSRQTMDAPNTFYRTGRCEECGKVTDIAARGCNFLAIFKRPGL